MQDFSPPLHPAVFTGQVRAVRGATLSAYAHNPASDEFIFGLDSLSNWHGIRNVNLAKGCADPPVLEIVENGSVTHRLVRCRKCAYCLKVRQAEWTHRASIEYYAALRTWWVTLTYRGVIEPDYEQVKLFNKRLRKRAGKFRFVCSTERGDEGNRLHWHMLIHCHDRLIKRREIEAAWGLGFVHARLAKTVGLGGYLAKYLAKTAGSDIVPSTGYGREAMLYKALRSDLAGHLERFERQGGGALASYLRLTKKGVTINLDGLRAFNRLTGSAMLPQVWHDVPF